MAIRVGHTWLLYMPPGLRSGDVVLTFKVGANVNTDENWAKHAFCPSATISRREYAVLAKGVPTKEATAMKEGTALRALRRDNNTKSINKIRPLAHKKSVRAAVVLHLSSVNEAQALCRNGLVWNAMVYDCEPFDASIQYRQCFKCY